MCLAKVFLYELFIFINISNITPANFYQNNCQSNSDNLHKETQL